MAAPSPTETFIHSKKNTLFIFLSGIFLTNAIIAEVIGVKIFSLEKLLQVAPAQLHLLPGFILDFNLTAGVVIWPFVFVTTDIINEYYGKSGVKRISYLAAGLIGYAFLVIYSVTHLPPADFWLEINNKTPSGTPFDVNFAFSTIFRQGLGIIIGSLTAFLVGQLVDVYTFHWLRGLTGSKKIWLRATGSTLVSQLIDSFVVLTVAFYLFGNWSLEQVISVGIINYIYKFGIAILMTPVLYVAHSLIDNYLGIKQAEKMEDSANKSY
jgi:uncharacterized integral membrane protein (TIGR00697 family)